MEELLIERKGLKKQGGSVWVGRGGGFFAGGNKASEYRSIV